MTVTIKDIAKEAGVSPAAVSKALNNRGGISVALKLKIEKIARRKGYSPYVKARLSGMYSAAFKYIGVIYTSAGGHLIKEVQSGIDSILKDSGYYELRYNTSYADDLNSQERLEAFLDKIIQDKNVAGLIFVFLKISDPQIAMLQEKGIQVIILNNYSDYGKCVFTDNQAAAYEATKELLKTGKKNVGLIMPEETSENIWQDRLEGYKKALREAKIRYNPLLVVYEHSFSLEESAIATECLLKRNPEVDAIIYGSDIQAYGGIKALKEMSKSIPDDIAVVGFDDMDFSRIIEPSLSSVRQPMFEMGQEAAKMLLEGIKKKSYSHRVIKLKSKFIPRQSTHKKIPAENLL